MRKQQYYCDCCHKQVKNENELHIINITFGMSKGIQSREICYGCLQIYYKELAKITNKMFKNEFVK